MDTKNELQAASEGLAVFHLKPGGVVRVVTARDSNQWERRCYQHARRD